MRQCSGAPVSEISGLSAAPGIWRLTARLTLSPARAGFAGDHVHRKMIVVEMAIFLPMFIAGFGCGFYLRDRILKNRRSRYPVNPYISQEVVPSPIIKPARIQAVAKPPPIEPKRVREVFAPKRRPNSELDVAAPLPPLDFKKIRMSEELRELLSLLPSDDRQKPPPAER